MILPSLLPLWISTVLGEWGGLCTNDSLSRSGPILYSLLWSDLVSELNQTVLGLCKRTAIKAHSDSDSAVALVPGQISYLH